MRMEEREPDVLMLEMIHGTVEINMIPLLAHQDGLVINMPDNALWPTQEMDLEVNQPAKTSANQTDQQEEIPIDATQLTIHAKLVKREILDVTQTEPLLVETVQMAQTQLKCSNVTKLIQNNQNARCALREIQLPAVDQEVKHANNVLQRKNFTNVMKRHLHAW